MKKVLVILMSIFIAVACGCGNKRTFVGGEYNIETDMQFYYRSYSDVLPVTASPKGYYYVGENGILLYIDKATMKATPLCNKPNCNHSDSVECNAYCIDTNMLNYFGDESLSVVIQYYMGNIYTIGFEYSSDKDATLPYLKKISLDGSKSEKITDTIDGFIFEWMIHRGYFYYTLDTGLYRVSLESPKNESEIVFEVKKVAEDSNNVNMLVAYDQYIYFVGCEYDEKNNISYSSSYIYDLEISEYKKIEYEDEKVTLTTFGRNKMIFQKGDLNNNEVIFYESDFDLSNPEKLTTQVFGYALFTDDNYIYTSDIYNLINKKKKQSITVYDYEMNKIDSFNLTQCTLAGQDNDYFFVWLKDKRKEDCLYAIDKTQLGTINGKTPEMIELCKMNWSGNDENDYMILE